MSDDPFGSRAYYDRLGEAERDRLVRDAPARASLEVHRRFLARFVSAGDRVLEIGAGPGRFTAELASLGARVHVTDFSPVQLDLNRKHLEGTGAESAVTGRDILDVRDVSRFDDASFDVVLAYGGPLSYAFEDAEAAFAGLLRIIRPAGYVVASVMSMLGTWRHSLPGIAAVVDRFGDELNDRVIRTGDLRHLPGVDHTCRMFRANQLRELVETAGGRVEAMSASNWASLGDPATVAALEAEPSRWAHFIENEVAACGESGTLDGGTHILVAATHP
ncbi:class I SAM-dependent methyltransferase [Pseudactinotalea sp.]|uniref:class I SAM-dependent methyltransferase n=1 Tax=Pseudactinotalea sp. TaxID=1926260 RepID=UPI003B3B09BC